MPETYVLDNHAVFWYLTADRRLSANAKAIIERAERGDCKALVSAITLAELYYLNDKMGKPLDFQEELSLFGLRGFELVPFEPEDVASFDRLQAIPEMHDRIIAALALKHDAELVTKDREISACAEVRTTW